MRIHPVALCLEGRRCVVVGGDRAAAAKAEACAAAGALVVVIAPEVEPEVSVLVAAGRVRHEARQYAPGDLVGALVAYASTRDAGLVARLVEDAARERVLLNVIDRPEASGFYSPAVVARGDLVIAVTTGGASPGLAARLRRELEGVVGPEYAPFVAILGAVRRALADDPARAGDRARVLDALIDSPLRELLRRGDAAEIDSLLDRVAGTNLARLGVALQGRV